MKVDSKDESEIVRLRAQRIAQGMSQSDVAAVFGVTKKDVSKWENPAVLTMPFPDELDRMEEAFTGFLTGVRNTALSIAESGGKALLWRSQESWEASGHRGSFERQNLKVVTAAMCLDYAGKVEWDDLDWTYADQ